MGPRAHPLDPPLLNTEREKTSFYLAFSPKVGTSICQSLRASSPFGGVERIHARVARERRREIIGELVRRGLSVMANRRGRDKLMHVRPKK